MKPWQFLCLCERTVEPRAGPRVQVWRPDMTESQHRTPTMRPWDVAMSGSDPGWPAAGPCASDRGRPGSRSCWCHRRGRSVPWGWVGCRWWCGSPSCRGCCGCTGSPPGKQQVAANSFRIQVLICVDTYRSVHSNCPDLVIVGVPANLCPLLEMTNPECSGVSGGDHGHQAATEQPLRYVHVRFIWTT